MRSRYHCHHTLNMPEDLCLSRPRLLESSSMGSKYAQTVESLSSTELPFRTQQRRDA